jgi:hypothetical protein
MFCAEIPMPFSHPTVSKSRLQQVPMLAQEIVIVVVYALKLFQREGLADKGLDFSHVLFQISTNHLWRSVKGSSIGCRSGAEIRQFYRDPIKVFPSSFSFLYQTIKELLLGEAAHLHRILKHSFSRARGISQDKAFSILHDSNHIQINGGCELAVQADFLMTKVATVFQRRVIEKNETNGLLDFVNVISGQKDV